MAALAVGLVAERNGRALAGAGAAVVAQLPWLVPGLVVAWAGVDLPDASAFATEADGPVGLFGLVAGHGFWRTGSQVGGEASAGVALLGLVLLVLALAGRSRLPVEWGGRATALAAVGLVLALATAVPGLRSVYDSLSATPLGAAGRESHRWLALFLVWMAPAAALGAVRLGGRALLAVPAAVGIVLGVPGLWGVDGRLEPVDIPSGWAEARAAVHRRPGPVVALPWHQYFDLGVAGGRRVLHPMPDYLGGDVITSADPELGQSPGHGDPRQRAVERALERLEAGEPAARQLADVGVRWVVVLHDVDWRRYSGLAGDGGLDRVVADRTLDLYRVVPWRGPVRAGPTDDGPPRRTDAVVAPLQRIDGDDAGTWARPYQRGWSRGTNRASRASSGEVRIPAAEGPLVFWPAALVLIAHVCAVLAAGAALGALLRTRALCTVGQRSTGRQ
jgi:hypothetical protein